jgi:hypothetical protein
MKAGKSDAPSGTIRAWLDDDEPFSGIIERIVCKRERREPRSLAAVRRRRTSRGRR